MGTRAIPVIAFGFDLGSEEEDLDFLQDEITASDDLNDRDWPVEMVPHGHRDYRYFFLSVRGTSKHGGDWGDALPVSAISPTADKIEAAQAWCKEHGITWRAPQWCALASYS